MQVLRRGSQGLQVQLLQRLLNKAQTRTGSTGTLLGTDGSFGALTESALQAFQTRQPGLIPDKVAGNQTWRALGLCTEKEHAWVRLFGQPTANTCWSAAATMILGNQSAGVGNAYPGKKGGLPPVGDNYIEFARSYGWDALNYSPSVAELVDIVSRTPVWVGLAGLNLAHAVVLSGVYSDGDERGDGTLFRIHDPGPIGRGRIYGSFANPITLYDASGITRVQTQLHQVIVPR
jgi:hypothetical protein